MRNIALSGSQSARDTRLDDSAIAEEGLNQIVRKRQAPAFLKNLRMYVGVVAKQ